MDFSNQNELLVKNAGIICLFLYFCADRMCQIYQKTAMPVVLTCYLQALPRARLNGDNLLLSAYQDRTRAQ